jgi:hypothetical protein
LSIRNNQPRGLPEVSLRTSDATSGFIFLSILSYILVLLFFHCHVQDGTFFAYGLPKGIEWARGGKEPEIPLMSE